MVLCKKIEIKTIKTEASGQLSFFECERDLPFYFKRIYYITGVDENQMRGFHAHKRLKQFIFCPYGSIEISLDDGINRESIVLNEPSFGILIEQPIWRELKWLKKDSVLVVIASEYYNDQDYIRDYNEYLDFVRRKKI